MSDPKSSEGFLTLKVKYLSESSVVRHLFIKEDEVRDEVETNPLKPNGKTLLVMNIPPFVDQHCIRHLFRDCGKIVNIFFHSKPTTCVPKPNESKYFDKREEIKGYKVCYVVFNKNIALKRALNLTKKAEPLALKPQTGDHLIGLKAMKQKYNDSIVDSNELQKEINDFMVEYDKRIEEEKLVAKQTDGVPDEEGWIKVNRYSKRKSLPNDYSNDERIVEKHNKRRKKSSNELINFYSYKQMETKFESLRKLRDKFEDDKKKIALIKAQRKFKPL